MATDEAPKAEETSVTEDDTQTELSDPDDIDALLDSMAADESPIAQETSVTEDDAQTELSDPGDIDALLDSMMPEESAEAEETPVTKDDTQTELSDPDDIDALLDSMMPEESAEAEEKSVTEDDTQTELSDPDDIDALLDSMAVDESAIAEEKSVTEDDAQTELSDPDDIDALLSSMNVGAIDNDKTADKPVDIDLKPEENSNKAKIESLTEEYVAPLLATDFSDILDKSSEKTPIAADTSQGDLSDDFDLDSLLDDPEINTTEGESTTESEFDIGDDLAEGAFDEEALAKLLNDEETDQVVELTPDFSDQNVLADLLNDNDDNEDNSQVSEATEINDIQELDSLNFDELLANIEEESSTTSQSVDFNEQLDVGDDVSLSDFENVTSNTSSDSKTVTTENDKDFVSVDSLLSESEYEESNNEPYDKANIDVGLNEFPEFTDDVVKVDVDIDETGMAAKLDLAKVYIEIGDQDNAQAILHEVLKHGDPQQQIEAQEFLNSL